MIITDIFLFLLGTKLGQAATKTSVKYEGPNQITVNEEKDDLIVRPGLGSPPFASNFFHQGSNFFFNPQFMVPGGFVPSEIKRATPPLQPLNDEIETPEVISDKITESEKLIVPELPMIEIEKTNQTLHQESIVKIDRIPIELPEPNPPIQALAEELSEDVEITNVPMLVDKPFQPSGELFMSEVNVRVNKIPPPPELPPLSISDIPKPVFVEERRVILIPSVPEIAPFSLPYTMADKNRLILADCVQNIIMERFLPNIYFENGNKIEIISIPATKRAPVVSSIMYEINK